MESFRKSLITEAAFNVKSLVTVVDKIRIILIEELVKNFINTVVKVELRNLKKQRPEMV